MAPVKRPSYLKRQKEQKRLARAAEKREMRLNRKHSKGTEFEDPEAGDLVADQGGSGEEAAT